METKERMVEMMSNIMEKSWDKEHPNNPQTKEEIKKKKKEEKQEEKEGRRIMRILRTLSRNGRQSIPAEVIDFTVQAGKKQAIATIQYLQFERNIAAFKFRSQIHMNDTELEDYITKNQIAIMNVAREFQIFQSWLMLSGYLVDFTAFREIIEKGIKEDIEKKKHAEPGLAEKVQQMQDNLHAMDERKIKAKELFK